MSYRLSGRDARRPGNRCKKCHQSAKINVVGAPVVCNFLPCRRVWKRAAIAAMIFWNEQFKTGSDELDQQHQMLIHNINHLEYMLGETNPSKESCAFLIRLVEFLESYAETHFRVEEDCMSRHRCPAHALNKQAHEAFLTSFRQFKDDARHRGFRPEAFRKLHQTMSQWIEGHILQVDTQLKPCLKAAG